MKQDETISEDLREFIQEWFVKPQLLDSDSQDYNNERSEGLKKIIQKEFVKRVIVEWDNLRLLLDDSDELTELYSAIENSDSKESAENIFNEAISEAKKAIAVDYDLAPRRKLEHEILSERLDKKFGEGHINNNINSLIQKNIGNGGEVDCDDGSCGSC